MSYRTIKGSGGFQLENAVVGESGIYPGMLLAINSSGEIIKHATQGGFFEAIFALENAVIGKTVADVLTAGDKVEYLVPGKGSKVHALLKKGENVSAGDMLVSNGDGTFVKSSSLSSTVIVKQVVFAMEDMDLTVTSTQTDTLISVRVA